MRCRTVYLGHTSGIGQSLRFKFKGVMWVYLPSIASTGNARKRRLACLDTPLRQLSNKNGRSPFSERGYQRVVGSEQITRLACGYDVMNGISTNNVRIKSKDVGEQLWVSTSTERGETKIHGGNWA